MRPLFLFVTSCLLAACNGKAGDIRWTPALGTNTTTLVLYSEKRSPYSLVNNLEMLLALLRQVHTRIEALPLAQATNELAADYVVVFCPQPPERVPPTVTSRARPMLWLGFGGENLATEVRAHESVADLQGFNASLLEFYGARPATRPRLLVRIEDYGCRSDHRQFRRVADLLFARGASFAVGVSDCDLTANGEFVRSLKYAEERGGRLVLRTQFTFWDATVDRPAVVDVAKNLDSIIAAFQQHGLTLYAWENSGPSPPRTLEPELAKAFPMRIGAVRLSDATSRDQFVARRILPDAHGGIIVPDHFGYVPLTGSNGFDDLQATARGLFASPGAVGSFVFHAYLPFSVIAAGMDELESWDVAFLDLAELRE